MVQSAPPCHATAAAGAVLLLRVLLAAWTSRAAAQWRTPQSGTSEGTACSSRDNKQWQHQILKLSYLVDTRQDKSGAMKHGR
jgi:hypothetical protein